MPLAIASLAGAQPIETGGWQIRTVGEVSPLSPFARVEVWAWFDDPSGIYDVFAAGDFDFVAADGAFRDPVVEIPAYKGATGPGLGTTPGEVIGSRVEGAMVGQFFGSGGLVGSPENPILVWSATWGTHDFTPRTVSLVTENTTSFLIGVNGPHAGRRIELFPDRFFHDAASIRVVPAPTTIGLMLLVIAPRRRRTS